MVKIFNLPPVMGDDDHPLAKFLSPQEVKSLRKAIKGDPTQMRRTSIAIYRDGLDQVDSELKASGFQVEFAKLGSIRMRYRADIVELIELCFQHNVQPHLGGQMIENAMTNGLSSRQIAESLTKMKLTTVEVSNSEKQISNKALDSLTRDLAKDFRVIREVGDKTYGNNTLKSMEDDLKHALDSDAHRIVIEGGGNGNAFIYNSSGRIKTLLLPRLLSIIDDAGQGERVMVETPLEHQREYMFNNYGWKSRIANVRIDDLQRTFEDRVTATDPQQQKKIDATQTKFRKLLKDVIEHCSHCKEHDVDTLFNSDMGGFDPTDLNHISHMRNVIIHHQQQVERQHGNLLDALREFLN